MLNNKFTMYDAVHKTSDIRHLVAIMFGETDLIFIKNVLEKSGYPFGSESGFAEQLRDVHSQWIKNGNDIEKVEGYFGSVSFRGKDNTVKEKEEQPGLSKMEIAEQPEKENPDLGKCKEKGCNNDAIIDYNEHKHYVCRSCYDYLSRYFDEEYR